LSVEQCHSSSFATLNADYDGPVPTALAQIVTVIILSCWA